jgi:hypothetical protein
MTQTARTLCITLIMMALQACSGIIVSQDYEQGYDFSKLKTFAWKPNDNHEYGVKDNELLDKRITTAIQGNLIARNYAPAESGTADFYVSYNYNTEQKISSSNVSTGIAFGRSAYGGFGGIGIGTGTDIRTYDQGTLLIDVTEVSSNKLVWRGISTQSVSEHHTPEELTEMVNETVEKMLLQFPPQ